MDRFHASALEAGGRDNGAPGLRPEYYEGYYGAYVFDPDANNVEAVHHAVPRIEPVVSSAHARPLFLESCSQPGTMLTSTDERR